VITGIAPDGVTLDTILDGTLLQDPSTVISIKSPDHPEYYTHGHGDGHDHNHGPMDESHSHGPEPAEVVIVEPEPSSEEYYEPEVVVRPADVPTDLPIVVVESDSSDENVPVTTTTTYVEPRNDRSQEGERCGYDWETRNFHNPCDIELMCISGTCQTRAYL